MTPSHHRVHHAINKEYIDKNYGQILIIWDKLFGTFQVELESVTTVYGTLKPARTWNPILINYKHLYLLFKDAWQTKRYRDKIIIWFMPTGWRPTDVLELDNNEIMKDPISRDKYVTDISFPLTLYCWAQLFFTTVFMFHLFTVFHETEAIFNYFYAVFIFLNIFSYTSLLDNREYSFYAEILKFFLGLGILQLQSLRWFNMSGFPVFLFLILSLSISMYFYLNIPKSAKLSLVKN